MRPRYKSKNAIFWVLPVSRVVTSWFTHHGEEIIVCVNLKKEVTVIPRILHNKYIEERDVMENSEEE